MLILGGNQLAAGGYNVDNSLRFNAGSSDYLDRTPSSAGNRKTFTFSFWIKRSNVSTDAYFGQNSSNGQFTTYLFINSSSGQLRFFDYTSGGAYNFRLETNRVFRDASAWYHIVVSFDSTQATSSDRVKIYVNGVQETSFLYEIYPSLNYDSFWNSTNQFYIGSYTGASNFYDGYLSEYVFIDGQQLDPTSFGEFDSDSGIWKPIDVSGLTFGTNGFYLPFENSAALGQDDSGNGNNFTVNNLTSIDQSTDTCTNNYCTLNPLNFGAGTLSEGNLKWAASGSVGYLVFGTIGIDMGVSNQFYWETKVDSIGSGVVIGIAPTTLRWNDTGRAGSYGYFSNGNKYLGTSPSAYGSSFTTGDTIGVLAGNGSITFYKNGVSQGVAWSGLSGTYLPFLAEISNTNSMNFGSPPYTISSGNTDPAGYGNFEYSTNGGYALNTKNLAEYG